MMDLFPDTGYRAARETFAVADLGSDSRLLVTGRDRLDFLHRLSTNDIRALAPGEGLPTVLTNPTGRIVSFLLVYVGIDTVYLRTPRGQGAAIAAYLNSMIFFQDDVEVKDIGETGRVFAMVGPAASAALGRITGSDASELPGTAYSWAGAEIAGAGVTIFRGGPLDPLDWRVVAPVADAAPVWDALAGGAPVVDDQTLNVLRVEAGVPAWGPELSVEVTPLETGLESAVNYRKGCYVGQEVIARQTNYDKIARRLVGLILPPGSAGLDGLSGSAVGAGTGRRGFVGTVVFSPGLGQTLALAVVPRELVQPGTTVAISLGGREISALVTALPFVDREHTSRA